MKKILQLMLLTAVLCLPLSIFAQLQSYSFTEIDNLQKTDKKNIVVFIHTDWCKYCQAMKNTTFKDEKVIKLLNENFWFTDLNAEEKQDINFNGHTFKYKPTGNKTGIHELAEQLASINRNVSYPTLCILNTNYEITFQYGGFLSSTNLLKVLNEALKNP